MLAHKALNYSCPLVLQISCLASTLLSLSNCSRFSKKEAFGVFQFTSSLSKHQKINLSCSAGRIHLPPWGMCPYWWPHASMGSNGCTLWPFFMEEATSIDFEEATNIDFQEAGTRILSTHPVPQAGASHTFHLFCLYQSWEGFDLGHSRFDKVCHEQLAHWPEIQASLYHLEKSKYTSKKRNQCPWPHGCGNSQGHCSCWLTMSQQLDTGATSHDNRTPASLAQHIPTPDQFKQSVIRSRAGSPVPKESRKADEQGRMWLSAGACAPLPDCAERETCTWSLWGWAR